jgi:UDP-N-acetylglucosamine 2-epimerase (non-hydrolysing)
MKNSLPIYFMMGTRAQFIKVAPILRKMLEQNKTYTLIYTAQHQENIDEILKIYELPKPDFVMYGQGEANTKSSFLRWFVSIFFKVIFHAKLYIREPGVLLTHGDTFTAWMAALMGKRTNCTVAHIESGCRSFNILSPFPEEISRLITFSLTDIYFCADEWAVNNLKSYRGQKINMGANTMLDGVRYAQNYPSKTHFDFENFPSVMVSIHRFENIFTKRLTSVILPILQEIATDHHLIFTLHPTTRERLRALGLYESLSAHPNITLHERFDFIDWINLCSKAEFVITDGGSNQEELSYLGVPTLLFRNESERHEGLGQNIVISRFDTAIIKNFVNNPEQYRRKPTLSHFQPSETIIQTISNLPL